MGVAEIYQRYSVIEGDARSVIPSLDGPFDLIFLDATKTEYPHYLELAEPKATRHAALVVDNLLMSGDVALEDDSEAHWGADQLRMARAFNADLVNSDRWLGCVLPIGDGVGFAARR